MQHRSALREAFVTWLAYALIAVVLFLPLVLHVRTHILADDVFIEPGRSDAYNFLWTYWWIQKAALSGNNLFECSWVLPPTGANLFFHTHVILPTLLTIPLGVAFGPVAGYNGMILLLLTGAASVYQAFLRRTFQLSRGSAFTAGALFGFSPYFVFKVHAHVNLVGAVFWAAALAVLVHAYVNDRFGWRSGALFSASLWATFWTSFIEFFALAVVCALTVLVFGVTQRLRHEPRGYADRLRFLCMTLPGATSLLAFRYAPDAHAIDIAPFPNIRLWDFVIPARLSLLGGTHKVSEFEYWGSHLPLLFVGLALFGVANMRKQVYTALLPVLAVTAVTAAVTINPFGAPLKLLRHLPLGTGFRVAGRFLPFVYFFALIPAAYGLDRLTRLPSRRVKGVLFAVAALAAAVELFPARLSPSAVKRFELPDAVHDDVRDSFTLIQPRGAYTNVLDTYQISMDVPVVHLSYLAREDRQAGAIRKARFPALYPAPPKLTRRVLAQMREAGVRYVLFEDRDNYYAGRLRGEPIMEAHGALLVRY